MGILNEETTRYLASWLVDNQETFLRYNSAKDADFVDYESVLECIRQFDRFLDTQN